MFCPNCGTNVQDSFNFCTQCGFNFEGIKAAKLKNPISSAQAEITTAKLKVETPSGDKSEAAAIVEPQPTNKSEAENKHEHVSGVLTKGGTMKQYKVFKHPSGSTEVVKQGWSWPAFSFCFIWAMVKKMWGLGVGVLLGFLMLAFIIVVADVGRGVGALMDVVSIIVYIIFGKNGNSWREKNLISRGFEQVDTVTAANPEGAVALYLKSARATER